MTFANLSENIEKAIADILARQEKAEWVLRAVQLHERYLAGKKMQKERFVSDITDALAYLAMRVPATYAQIYGALESVQEVIPSWQPKSILDIGSGPGTGVWAAKSVWPDLEEAVCIDQDRNLLSLGKEIADTSELSVRVSWKLQDVRRGLENSSAYDLVIVGNVFNELSAAEGEKLLGQAFNACKGVLLVVEPGTPLGAGIVQSTAQKLAHAGKLLAPYVNGAFVKSDDYFLHFPQRFIRPEFQRRVRQHMRDSSLMASDWEDAKYAYAAISKIPSEHTFWGRCVGPVHIQKGFLEVPVLTSEGITTVKVMKRNKEQYALAKGLKWGEVVLNGDMLSNQLINQSTNKPISK